MNYRLWIALLALAVPLKLSAEPTPSSSRSRAAVQRVTPKLTGDLAKQNLKLGNPVFIRIFKDPAILQVWIKKDDRFERFRTYPICKFSGTLGPKLKEGDNQAPEGFYSVGPSQMNPNSRFHLSFNLGYPNAFDAHHGRTGSALMVHGSCRSIGCYAMGDDAIEEIWTLCSSALDAGQTNFPVHIFPFPLTDAELKRHESNQWIKFWREIKPIYDSFEQSRVPPAIVVKEGRYTIAP